MIQPIRNIVCRGVAVGMSLAAAVAAFVVAVPVEAANAPAKPATASQTAFASPDEAFKALVDAVKTYDRATLAKLLGPGASRIIDSGDPIADRDSGKRFADAYAQKHEISHEGDATATLVVGDDWPLPIPVVKDARGWHFDARAGEREILARRVGRNELSAIQACLAYVDAQKDYASVDRNGDGLLEYARKFVSSKGKHDGLYWPTGQGDAQSPLGPLFAEARAHGYGAAGAPYFGYRYRILTAQGPHAQGGARNYVVRGRLIGGFALVAYPARYGDSGVKTFICNQDGIVYEKDLGAHTAEAANMARFDPDSTWKKALP